MSFEIESETELADGKVLRATNSFGNQIVVVARWLEGRTEYLFCRYSTSKPEVYRRASFEEACRAAAIDDSPRSSRA